MTARDYGYVIGIAVAVSFALAAIEISNKAKTKRTRALLGYQSTLYFTLLSLGNVVTSLLASLSVGKISSSLADFYFLFSAFFGVFAFEAILKNTNVTMFDKGVLTIQDWLAKALDIAVAASIARDLRLKDAEDRIIEGRLMQRSEVEINTQILQRFGPDRVALLNAAAAASQADPKLYKVLQIIAALSDSERGTLLRS